MAKDPITNAFGVLAERTSRNTERLTNVNRQRRNLVMDDFDKEYTVTGTNGTRGQLWLAMSPDYIYIERWEFKVIVQPTLVPLKTGSEALTPVTLSITPVEVNVEETNLTGTVSGSSVTIRPNPHDHEVSVTQPHIDPATHTHQAVAGATMAPPEFDDVHIYIDGHDITAYLKAQHNWIEPDPGMYPDSSLENRYDLLQVMDALDDDVRASILKQGYHLMEFEANGLFTMAVREFKKYNSSNRHGHTTGG